MDLLKLVRDGRSLSQNFNPIFTFEIIWNNVRRHINAMEDYKIYIWGKWSALW
jgi:hypothetical protein